MQDTSESDETEDICKEISIRTISIGSKTLSVDHVTNAPLNLVFDRLNREFYCVGAKDRKLQNINYYIYNLLGSLCDTILKLIKYNLLSN